MLRPPVDPVTITNDHHSPPLIITVAIACNDEMQMISTRPPVAARPKRRRSARTEIASPATLGGKVRLVELRKSSTQFAQSSPPSKCPTQVPAFKVPDPRHEPSARSIVSRRPAVMIAVLCRACADRAISSNQPVRVRASDVLALCCSASGLERSNREDEGGAERSAAAHGDRGGLPFDGISSMTLAASPCLFSLVSCKRTDGPLARAACASSSCPCSHTASLSFSALPLVHRAHVL